MTQSVFVFGSNLAGRHGLGSALEAKKHHGAIYGQGSGRQGNSYAIPTKDENLRVLPIHRITPHVKSFLAYAKAHPELHFKVVAIGCGAAGYHPRAIAPMFKGSTANIYLPEEFNGYVT